MFFFTFVSGGSFYDEASDWLEPVLPANLKPRFFKKTAFPPQGAILTEELIHNSNSRFSDCMVIDQMNYWGSALI